MYAHSVMFNATQPCSPNFNHSVISCPLGRVLYVKLTQSLLLIRVQLVVHLWLCPVGRAHLVVSSWSCALGRVHSVVPTWLCLFGRAHLCPLGLSTSTSLINRAHMVVSTRSSHSVRSTWSCPLRRIQSVMPTRSCSLELCSLGRAH